MRRIVLSKEWFEKWDAIDKKELEEFITFCQSSGYELIHNAALVIENISYLEAVNTQIRLSGITYKPRIGRKCWQRFTYVTNQRFKIGIGVMACSPLILEKYCQLSEEDKEALDWEVYYIHVSYD